MPTTLELAANITITLSIFLAARNSIHTWWIGIVGCALFAILFFQAKLYAEVTLQFFFIVTSGFGWWQWLHGDKGKARPISRCKLKSLSVIIPISLGATACYGGLLYYFTDAYAPFIDTSVLVFSIAAQLLLMQRKLETWYFWILVNTLAVPLFASRELWLTSALYAVYWVNAVVAARWWRQLQAKQTEAQLIATNY